MKFTRYITLAAFTALFCLTASESNAQSKLDRSVRPKPGPAPKVQIGKIESFQLENGLKVFVVENHKLPKVSYSLMLNLDPMSEGNIKGYSEMLGSLLGTATKNRTKDQINKESDFIGASLNTSSTGIYGSSLKKHNEKLLELMSDILLNPVFNQDEMDKIKTQTLSGLQASKNTPESMAANVSGFLNYGKNHPYGEITTEETVKNISLDDCKSYYETYFKPNVAYLAIVGDITPDEAKKLAEKYFGGWRKGNVPQSPVPSVVFPKSTQLICVPRSNSVQSSVRITYPIDIKQSHPDALKIKVLNEILGGGSSARLFRNLRETYNLTYGAYSSISTDQHIGNFNAFAEVRTAGTDSSVNEFMKEIIRLRTEKVGQEELQGVINALTGKFAIGLEDPATIARFAINIDRYNLPKDYYENYLANLAKITADDVYEVAQKYLRPENAWIVVVGDRDKMPDLIARWKEKNALTFMDQYGNPIIETRPAPSGLTAEKGIENYLNAIGGTANIKKIQSMVMRMSGELQGFKLEIVTKKQNPKKKGLSKSSSSIILNGAMVVQKTVFDGAKGKQSGMAGEKMIEGEELEKMKLEAQPHAELRYAELGYKLKLIGIDKINNKDAYKVEITDPKGEIEFTWYDVESGLAVKKEATQDTPQGQVTSTTLMSDYREVNGVKFPYKIYQEVGPQIMDLTVTLIEINGKIDPKEFEVK
ncbi:MAG TPA: pitrilysin family protein [Flavobacteriales bacterium]|nr:pitrilysin family protein [Flavobacteriales bacterium]